MQPVPVFSRPAKCRSFSLTELIPVVFLSVPTGVRGAGPVPADPKETPAQRFQGRLPPFPPDPEHPRVTG